MSRQLFWLPLSLIVALCSNVAHATENFPPTVAMVLGLSTPPDCTLCHTTQVGVKTTATQPFARKLQGYGLTANDAATLTTILLKMRDTHEDTDQDGMSDIDEIKAGRNPNINDITGELAEDYPPPVYGCQVSTADRGGTRVAGGGGSIVAAGLFVALLLGLRGRLRRSALVLLAAGSLACQNAPLDVVDGVDLARFQGRWYEIARLPRATQIDCAATTADYKLTSEGELVVTNACNVGGLSGVRRQVKASAKVTNAAVPAKLSVDFGGFYGDYWIIDLDRDGYGYAVVGHPTRQYLWILSRNPTLEASTLAPILERANQKGFDTSRLEYTKQLP